MNDEIISKEMPIVNNAPPESSEKDPLPLIQQVKDFIEEDEVELPPKDALQALALELVQQQEMDVQQRVLQKLANAKSVEKLVRQHDALTSMLLNVAEDLNITIIENSYNYTGGIENVQAVSRELSITKEGYYNSAQLANIAYNIRKAVERAKINEGFQINLANQAKKDLETAKEKINDLNKQLIKARELPPSIDAYARNVVLFYRDTKNEKVRTKFLTQLNGQYKVTRKYSEAITFASFDEAVTLLSEVLKDTAKHLIPKSYMLEVGKINLTMHSIENSGQAISEKIKSLRVYALTYENEMQNKGKTSLNPKKIKIEIPIKTDKSKKRKNRRERKIKK